MGPNWRQKGRLVTDFTIPQNPSLPKNARVVLILSMVRLWPRSILARKQLLTLTQVDYSQIHGDLYTDNVDIGGRTVTGQNFGLATKGEARLMNLKGVDGILGLAFTHTPMSELPRSFQPHVGRTLRAGTILTPHLTPLSVA